MLNIFRPFAIISLLFNRVVFRLQTDMQICVCSVLCSFAVEGSIWLYFIRCFSSHYKITFTFTATATKSHIECNMCIDFMPLMNISTILVRCVFFFSLCHIIIDGSSCLCVCVCSSWLYNLKQFSNLSTRRKWLTVCL